MDEYDDRFDYRFSEQIIDFIQNIGRDSKLYLSNNSKISISSKEWELETAIAMARTGKVIEGLFIGIDSSVTGGSEAFKIPLAFIKASISCIGLPEIFGKPLIIMSGKGDAYGTSIDRWNWEKQDLESLVGFAHKGEKPLDMHKYIRSAIAANSWIAGGVDGFMFLVSQEPDQMPDLEEVAFIKGISDRLLWLFPKYKQLEHDGEILGLWDEGFRDRISYFPDVDEI